MDYNPGTQKKEDLALSKGDVVQLISTDSGWMFVLYVNGDIEQQGWVPENYLERRHDVNVDSFGGKVLMKLWIVLIIVFLMYFNDHIPL